MWRNRHFLDSSERGMVWDQTSTFFSFNKLFFFFSTCLVWQAGLIGCQPATSLIWGQDIKTW